MSFLMRSAVAANGIPSVVNVPWSPLDSADLSHWIDPGDATTLTETGNNLTSIADKSSGGNDMTAGNNPQTGTRTINGVNVIDFAGGTEYLQSTAFQPANDFQFVGALQCDDPATNAANYMRLGDGSRFRFRHSNPTFWGPYLELYNTGNVSAGYGGSSGHGSPMILRTVFDHTNNVWEYFINGTSRATAALGTVFGNERYVLGSDFPGNPAWDGAIGQTMFFDNVGADDGQKAEGLLADVYGITLDAGHPYVGGPP